MRGSTHFRKQLEALWRRAQDEVGLSAGAHWPVRDIIPAPAFFPGGLGCVSESALNNGSCVGGVMFIGQDFGTVEYAEKVLQSGQGEDASVTWRVLLDLLKAEGINAQECFFTNALLGLRPGAAMTGNAPGWRDPRLVEASRAFLREQIGLIRPAAIFALGLPAARFLGGLAPSLKPWSTARSWAQLDRLHPVRYVVPGLRGRDSVIAVGALLHPSFRAANLHRRQFRGQQGSGAESTIIAETFNRPSGNAYTRMVASEHLHPADIPSADATGAEMTVFAYTFEGYEYAGSFEQLQRWTERNVSPTSIDMARAMLFGHVRWMRSSDGGWDNWHMKGEFLRLLDYVRAEVARVHDVVPRWSLRRS